jgi:hypothetical protein
MKMPSVVTDSFTNDAGLAQIWGRIGTFKWFFHARSGHWEFHLVEQPGRTPDCAVPDDGDYWEEGQYDTSCPLTNEDASALAFSCVRRYWATRGRQSFYRRE